MDKREYGYAAKATQNYAPRIRLYAMLDPLSKLENGRAIEFSVNDSGGLTLFYYSGVSTSLPHEQRLERQFQKQKSHVFATAHILSYVSHLTLNWGARTQLR
ncbi:MAG: hypothetical protein AAGF25_12410 [Pseudomonadota bacterium]